MGLKEFFANIGKGFKGAFKSEPGLKDWGKPARDGQPGARPARDEEAETYDAWEDIKNLRYQFFLGSWATKKVRAIPGSDDKLRAELEALEKKREARRLEKELQKAGLEEGQTAPVTRLPGGDKLKAELEAIDRKRKEKEERKK